MMKAMILCAGKGERLMPLTKDIPKPMIPINDKPVLEYLIGLCKKQGVSQIGINTSYLPEKIKEYFGDGSRFGVELFYSYEQELLGTSGALNNFREFLDETFFVIYGDNITNLNLRKMLDYHKSHKGLATMYLYREPIMDSKTTPGCVIVDDKNQIKKIIERPNEEERKELDKLPEKNKLTNAGLYVVEPSVLKLIPKGFSDFSKDIFPKVLEVGEMYGYKEDCYFKEVGQLIRYEVAKKDIESGKVKFDFI